MEVTRGEIWWADLGTPEGSEPGFRRPVVVVSADSFNFSSIGTVIVVSITSNLRLANFPGNVLLRESANGLSRPSVANVAQIATIDRARLLERAGVLSPDQLRSIGQGLRLTCGL